MRQRQMVSDLSGFRFEARSERGELTATTFRSYEPDPWQRLPPDIRESVPAGHLTRHLSDLVDRLDLTAFHAPHEGDGRRDAPYEPRMMVKVLIHAYGAGVFSSRQIARKLEIDEAGGQDGRHSRLAEALGLGVPGVERQAPTTTAGHMETGRQARRDRPSGAIGALGAARPPSCDSPRVTRPPDGPPTSLPAIMTRPVESSAAPAPGNEGTAGGAPPAPSSGHAAVLQAASHAPDR